jgi:hypothetical protein
VRLLSLGNTEKHTLVVEGFLPRKWYPDQGYSALCDLFYPTKRAGARVFSWFACCLVARQARLPLYRNAAHHDLSRPASAGHAGLYAPVRQTACRRS